MSKYDDMTITEREHRYLWKIATKYRNTGVALEDYVQVGYIGAMQARKRFDPSFGVPWLTYMGMSASTAMRNLWLKECKRQPITVEFHDNQHGSRKDDPAAIVIGEEAVNSKLDKIKSRISLLTPLERMTLECFYMSGTELTLREAGLMLGRTETQIKSTKATAINKLRKSLTNAE